MARVKLLDEVGRSEVEIDIDDHVTVGAAIDHVVSHLGLPRRSTNGVPLQYSLAVEGREQGDLTVTLAEAGVVDGTTLTLISSEARETWAHIQGLVDGLRAEVVAGVRAEVEGVGDRIRKSAIEEVRGVVRSVTGDIESEVTRRIRGAGKQVSVWARYRIRRMAKQLARTGAMPDELRALSFATGQLSSVAQAAMVAPVAALALAASGAAAAAALEAREAQATAEQAMNAADVATQLAETAQRRADSADLRAEAADLRAGAAQAAADAAQLAADTHQADRNDPHQVQVIATVGDHVIERLGADPGLSSVWVSEILGEAERQIDEHLSTVYAASGVSVKPEDGDSLWQIAEWVLGGELSTDCDLPAAPLSAREVAVYVTDLWVANIGVIGSDANLIEVDQPLQIVCPRGQDLDR